VSRTEKVIRTLWKLHDRKWTLRHGTGLSVPSMLRTSSRQNRTEKLPNLDAWLLMYDELVCWFVTFVAVARKVSDATPGKTPKEATAYFFLAGSIVAHLLAIRKLALSGFDLAARQVLRSLCEYVDVWQLLVLKPEAVVDFLNTHEADSSNAFWYRHLSKGKARKVINDWRKKLAPDGLDDHLKWRSQEDGILSMAAHPSIMASIAATMTLDDRDDESRLAFWGVKSENSIRTISCAIYTAAEIPLFAGQVLFEDRGNAGPIVRYADSDILHKHLKQAREVVVGLVLYAVAERTSAELKYIKPVSRSFGDKVNLE